MCSPGQIDGDILVTQPFQPHFSTSTQTFWYPTDLFGSRICSIALLVIGVMADGAAKRGLGANDDVLITVSAI